MVSLQSYYFVFFVFIIGFFKFTVETCKHNGLTYRNGKEWKEREAFVMRCTIFNNGSWKTEVVACILKRNGRRILINSSIEDHNDEWRCRMNDQGLVTLTQHANPNAKCDGKAVGSRWQEKSFQLECRPGGIRRLVACISEDGQRIPVNGSKEVKGFTLVCQQFGNGTVIFHGAKSVKPSNKITNIGRNQPSVLCVDENGLQRSIGNHWIENHRFNKTCRTNGAVEVVNCISKEGYQIPLNGQLIRDGFKYNCEMTTQGTIRFASGPVTN